MAFYTQTFFVNPATITSSQAVEDEFALIESAFASVDTQKANIASPTFTGDPKAPTPVAGDNDTSIATTAFVTTAIAGAAGINLPSMGGNANKVLTNNGTIPQWQPMGVGGATLTAQASSITLTAASAAVQSIQFSANGLFVKLPDATTLVPIVHAYCIRNTGSWPFVVRNNTGAIVGFVNPSQSVIFSLRDNSTSAGGWEMTGGAKVGLIASFVPPTSNYSSFHMTEVGAGVYFFASSNGTRAIVYDSTTGTWGAEQTTTWTGTNVATAIARLDNSNVLLMSSDGGSANLRFRVATLTGAVISFGAEQTVAAGLTPASFSSRIFPLTSSSAIAVFGNATNVQAIGLSISGATVTGGTSVALATGASGGAFFYGDILSTTRILVIGGVNSNTSFARTVDIAGTVLTANTSAAGSTASSLTVTKFSGSGRYIAWGVVGTGEHRILSVSGTTCTWTAATNTGETSSNGTYGYLPIDGTRVIYNGDGANLRIIQDNAGAISAGSQVASGVLAAISNAQVIGTTPARFTYSGTTLTSVGLDQGWGIAAAAPVNLGNGKTSIYSAAVSSAPVGQLIRVSADGNTFSFFGESHYPFIPQNTLSSSGSFKNFSALNVNNLYDSVARLTSLDSNAFAGATSNGLFLFGVAP